MAKFALAPGTGRGEIAQMLTVEKDRAKNKEQQQEQRDTEDAHERSAPGGKVIYKAVLLEAEEELGRSTSALFWSGIAAGLSMGLSMITEGMIRARLPEAHWLPLVARMGYSVGFIIVILGRQQLFTENTLTPILPLLQRRDAKTFWNVMRLWGVVLLANMIGAAAVALVAVKTSTFNEDARAAFLAIGHHSMMHSFGTTVLRAIFAGWLIAIMVWMLPFAEAARFFVILLITWVVGICDFAHVVAGAVDGFALAWAGEKTWLQVLGGFLLPTLIGNIIGGVLLVAGLNHAQLEEEHKGK